MLQLQRGLGIMINSVKGAEGILFFTTGYSNAFLTLVAHNLKCNLLQFHNKPIINFYGKFFWECMEFSAATNCKFSISI